MGFRVTKVGLLGESLNTAVGTHTVYSIGSGYTAMVKLMWDYQGNASVGLSFDVWVGSLQIYQETGQAVDSVLMMVQGQGSAPVVYDPSSLFLFDDANNLGPSQQGGRIMAPSPWEYGLGSDESVRYVISTNAADSMVFRVQGKEFEVG